MKIALTVSSSGVYGVTCRQGLILMVGITQWGVWCGTIGENGTAGRQYGTIAEARQHETAASRELLDATERANR